MMNLLIILCSLFIALPLYANPCMQVVMGGSTDEAAPPAACETQTTPNDMETSAYDYTYVAQASSLKYVASKFVADATTGTVCRICLSLNKIQSPTMDFSVQIWGDTGGRPNPADVKSIYGSMNAANIVGTFGDCFSLGNATLVNGTTYHVVIVASTYNATDYFRWVRDSTCTTEVIARSANGTTWYDIVTDKCSLIKLYTVAP
jgi:hypothetical protein